MVTSKTYRAMILNSSYSCRRRVQEWLPQEHLCYFTSNVADGLDLSDIPSAPSRTSPA